MIFSFQLPVWCPNICRNKKSRKSSLANPQSLACHGLWLDFSADEPRRGAIGLERIAMELLGGGRVLRTGEKLQEITSVLACLGKNLGWRRGEKWSIASQTGRDSHALYGTWKPFWANTTSQLISLAPLRWCARLNIISAREGQISCQRADKLPSPYLWKLVNQAGIMANMSGIDGCKHQRLLLNSHNELFTSGLSPVSSSWSTKGCWRFCQQERILYWFDMSR